MSFPMEQKFSPGRGNQLIIQMALQLYRQGLGHGIMTINTVSRTANFHVNYIQNLLSISERLFYFIIYIFFKSLMNLLKRISLRLFYCFLYNSLSVQSELEPIIAKRAEHYFTENRRVAKGIAFWTWFLEIILEINVYQVLCFIKLVDIFYCFRT